MNTENVCNIYSCSKTNAHWLVLFTQAQNAETIDLAEQSQTKLPTSGAQKNKVIGFVSDLGHTFASEMNNFGKTVSNKTAGKGAKQVTKEIASETLDTVKYVNKNSHTRNEILLQIWNDAKKAFSDLKGMFRRSNTTNTNVSNYNIIVLSYLI